MKMKSFRVSSVFEKDLHYFLEYAVLYIKPIECQFDRRKIFSECFQAEGDIVDEIFLHFLKIKWKIPPTCALKIYLNYINRILFEKS